VDGADHFLLESSAGVLVDVEESDPGVFLIGLLYRSFQEISNFPQRGVESGVYMDFVGLQRERNLISELVKPNQSQGRDLVGLTSCWKKTVFWLNTLTDGLHSPSRTL